MRADASGFQMPFQSQFRRRWVLTFEPHPPSSLHHARYDHVQVIAIDVDDPLAKELNDISDVEKQLPGHVSGIREWFRWYKTPDDKPLNEFGFGEKALSKVGSHCDYFMY